MNRFHGSFAPGRIIVIVITATEATGYMHNIFMFSNERSRLEVATQALYKHSAKVHVDNVFTSNGGTILEKSFDRVAWGSVTVASDRVANRSQIAGIEQCGIDNRTYCTSVVYMGFLLDHRLSQSLPAKVPKSLAVDASCDSTMEHSDH